LDPLSIEERRNAAAAFVTFFEGLHERIEAVPVPIVGKNRAQFEVIDSSPPPDPQRLYGAVAERRNAGGGDSS